MKIFSYSKLFLTDRFIFMTCNVLIIKNVTYLFEENRTESFGILFFVSLHVQKFTSWKKI